MRFSALIIFFFCWFWQHAASIWAITVNKDAKTDEQQQWQQQQFEDNVHQNIGNVAIELTFRDIGCCSDNSRGETLRNGYNSTSSLVYPIRRYILLPHLFFVLFLPLLMTSPSLFFFNNFPLKRKKKKKKRKKIYPL